MSEVLTLKYSLAELPSAQHRAGLAGLVLVVDWLKHTGHAGTCNISDLAAEGATLQVDREGLNALFAELYAPQRVEIPSKKEDKKKTPIRIEEGDSGKIYIYEDFIPKAGQIADWDRSQEQLWLKLWRDFLWALRKQPASRTIFKDSDKGKKSRQKTAQDTWEQLKGSESAVKLAGTNLLGVQEKNTEIVPFKDRGKFEFLLNFWPYAIQIYEPVYRNFKGKLKSAGYAIAIPDVANLEYFCEDFPDALRNREQKQHPYFKSRPNQAILNLAPAAGLEFLKCLRQRLAELEGKRNVADLIFAVEVCLLSVSDDGQKNEIRELVRLTPEESQIDAFARVRENCWDTVFTAQRLKNVLGRRLWYVGFDRLCASLDIAQIFGPQSYFCRDARKSFEVEVIDLSANAEQNQPLSLEALIYKLVDSYLGKRLKEKYELVWDKVKDDEAKKEDYSEKREKLAKEVFYGFRSRSGTDFANYFAITMGSVNQSYLLKEQNFELLAQLLYKEPDRVKSITLLALSARG
ncbi:type I-MYXAN CRISPR-associated protein Cmx8 [Kamptonema formosum]|uniref:type I-MYXAN CRISPR-associated protein Cmx8 n=1 Tax=Kamptonema formosum TaxID=331992 RepID=UPI0003487EB3|nr:type I-MYXAN CRISPR-associated protein Cmx8 [Oscillatoria sp. PCC 10802]